MAVFVIQLTFQGTGFTVPLCSSGPYADVDCTYWAAKWIAEEARRQVTTGCGGGNFCPGNYVTRAAMAGLIVHAFDIPYKIDPATPRNVQFTYLQGLLTGVTGAVPYGTLSYYPNLLVNQVAHGNGVNETQGNDPFEMRRPLSVGASGLYTSWSSGNYAYDGSGNIKTIGNSTFTYDPVSRLVASTQYDGANGAGNPKQQSYTFDAFGNLTSIAGTSGRNTPTSPQTNRLNGAGTVYDAAGNLTNWNNAVYVYDAFNQMIRMTSGAEDWGYAYTADDERLWMYNIGANTSRWTLRDLNGKVLREYLNNHSWSVGTDYIYRDGLLLAAETQTGQRHFHLDHLGTPRLITRAGGERVAYHVYYPFGEEATTFNQDSERMKFTGHERDLASPAGPGDDLDYMHARHESPVTGRFLSVDAHRGNARSPQSWNRYAYTHGNPLNLVDPNGREPLPANLLHFFNVLFDADFSRVDIQRGIVGHVVAAKAHADAVTVGSTVFLAKSEDAGYEASAPASLSLIAHELTHVLQYNVLGVKRFLQIYIHDYDQNKTNGMSDYDAYKHLVVEEIADRVQGIVQGILDKNPDIASALASGQELTEEQARRVADAFDAASAAGVFKTGYQFVQGFLVYVPK